MYTTMLLPWLPGFRVSYAEFAQDTPKETLFCSIYIDEIFGKILDIIDRY